jgi:hypothetical protein
MSSLEEKAEELLDRYETLGKDFTRGVSMREFAKQCALIAVDEIIKSNPCYESSDRGLNFSWQDNTYYWQEVKQEIEKL